VCFVVRKTTSELERVILTTLFLPVQKTLTGGEYERLSSFFCTIDISHHVSYLHAHQQNSVAERKHRHIIEMGLSDLPRSHSPHKPHSHKASRL
jgi:hypothetical protein